MLTFSNCHFDCEASYKCLLYYYAAVLLVALRVLPVCLSVPLQCQSCMGPSLTNQNQNPKKLYIGYHAIQRKLRLFGHICRMNDSRKIKTLVFGMMDGSNKRGWPHREWSDDIEQWCGTTLQELSHAALDRLRWAAILTMASDTNGHWAHGCRWWWWDYFYWYNRYRCVMFTA